MLFRTANRSEINTLITLRKQQLIDEGVEPNINIDKELIDFFNNKMSDGSLIEWIAVENNKIIATAAIVFYSFPPSYTNKSGIKGYITNIYTVPEYRKLGIATSLINMLIDEAKKRHVEKLCLSASKVGKPIYLKHGFYEKNEWLELSLI